MTMLALEGQARRLEAKRAPNLNPRDGVSAGADRERVRNDRENSRRFDERLRPFNGIALPLDDNLRTPSGDEQACRLDEAFARLDRI
jgi:hypothetical protein